MAQGDIRTYYENDEWKSKVEGSSRAAHVGGNKAEQSAIGRDMARERGVEHRITNRQDQIKEANTYPRSRDPRSSKG